MTVPMVNFFGQEVSRLICGSNPFLGYSYRSPAHNKWQRRTFTRERISEVLEKCLEVGINTLLGNMDDDRTLPRALNLLERRTGSRMKWIRNFSMNMWEGSAQISPIPWKGCAPGFRSFARSK